MDNALLMSVPPATTHQKDHSSHLNRNFYQEENTQIKSESSLVPVNSLASNSSSMSDPHHRTMLHILEQLLDLKGVPLSIQSLYDNIYSANNTQQPIIFVNNAEGLRRFLARYPSLFRLEGDFVHAAVDDSGLTVGADSSNGSVMGMADDTNGSRYVNNGVNGSVFNRGVKLRPRRIDISAETESVKFFQTRLMSKQDRWIPIRSLAGHLSQASSQIREAVGPQSRFREFILRHPLVFEVQGELVGLRNRFSHMCINRPLSMVMSPSSAATSTTSNGSSSASSKSRGNNNNNNGKVKLRSGPNNSDQKRPTSMVIIDDYKRTSTSEDILGSYGYNFNNTENNIQYNRNSISPEEFQAALYLRSILQKQTSASLDQSKSSNMDLGTLFVHLARAPPAIRDCIGWTRIELEQFIRKMPTLFELFLPGNNDTSDIDDSVNSPNWCVRPINQSFNLLESAITTPVANPPSGLFGNSSPVSMTTDSTPITPIQQQTTPVTRGARTIVNHQGCVYHVTKLWGIIDLGQHEHVFFDISIFKHLDNLEKYFKIGETVYFNAILAPKQSRAKWRATQLWKETDNDIVKHLCNDLLTPLFNTTTTTSSISSSNNHHHHNPLYANHHCHQAPRFQSNGPRDELMEDDDLVSLYSPSVLLEQQVVLENQKNIDDELAEILQMTKVNGYYDNDEDDEDEGEFEDYDEDDDDHVNKNEAQLIRNNTYSNNNDSTSIISGSTDISSASGIFQNSNGGCSNPLSDQQIINHKALNSSINQSTISRQQCCSGKKMVEMSTQTLSTGEIMSVAMYHD